MCILHTAAHSFGITRCWPLKTGSCFTEVANNPGLTVSCIPLEVFSLSTQLTSFIWILVPLQSNLFSIRQLQVLYELHQHINYKLIYCWRKANFPWTSSAKNSTIYYLLLLCEANFSVIYVNSCSVSCKNLNISSGHCLSTPCVLIFEWIHQLSRVVIHTGRVLSKFYLFKWLCVPYCTKLWINSKVFTEYNPTVVSRKW